MTKSFEQFDIEILNSGVLITVKSKRIKQYLDYIENKTDYREFTVSLNRYPCIYDTRDIGKFYGSNGINLQWLTDRSLDSGIDYLYNEILTKPDFNKWIQHVQLRIEAMNREIDKTYSNAISSMTRNDMTEKVTVIQQSEVEQIV